MSKQKMSDLTKAPIILLMVVGAGFAYVGYTTLNGGSSDESDNFASMAITVYFADGTLKTFESSTPYSGKLSTVTEPMSVYVGGQEITGIRVDCKVTLNDAPTIKSWTSNVRQRMELYTSGQATPLTSSTGEFPNSGTSWLSGTTKTISTIEIPVGQVESAIASVGGNGVYNLQVVDEVTLTVTDSTGSQTTLTGSSVGSITLTYKDNSAMSITVNTQVLPLY